VRGRREELVVGRGTAPVRARMVARRKARWKSMVMVWRSMESIRMGRRVGEVIVGEGGE